jgi:WD40 repeat protein
VQALAVLEGGRRALSGSDDRTLRLWDLDSGQCLRTLRGHSDSVRALAVLEGGCRALSGSDDSTLRLWDLDSGQ